MMKENSLLKFKKILFVVKNIPEAPDTTPHQRFKLITKELNGLTFLGVKDNDFLDSNKNDIIFSNNIISQFLKILFYLVKYRSRNIKVLLWTNYEPINLTFLYLCKKIIGAEILADIWDSPSLQIEINLRKKGLKNILKQKLRIFFYNFIKKRLTNFNKIIFSINPLALKDFNNFDDILSKSLQVTNGISEDTIDLIETTKKNEKDREEIWITYVGFIKKIRGIDLVLKGINRIFRELKNFKLILIGPLDEYDKEWFDNETKNNLWKDKIVLTGYLPYNETIRYLKSSDILLFPFPQKKELEYIYPIKIFEYLAVNKKIVSSNLTGVRKILNDFEEIYFFRPGDAIDFSVKILSAIKNKTKVNNFKKLKSLYLWEDINEKILKYFLK